MITEITNKKNLLMLILLIACSVHVMAQTDYYYYKGKQVPLTLNEDKIVVSIPKECVETSERIRANVLVLDNIRDQAFDIFVISQLDFEKLTSMETWEEDAKSVVLTACYFTERKDEVYSTPYLNVKLKKEQDIDMLISYAEEYKLKIVESDPLLVPLWYILSLCPGNEKNSLQCANELYETGNFPASVADFAASGSLVDDTTPVRGITLSLQRSGTYDLQGRRIFGKPQRGIYIEDGKKKVK